MRLRVRWPSKPTTFAMLMVLAALASLLGPRWTNWIRAPFQMLALPQHALLTTVYGVRDSFTTPTASQLTPAEVAAMQRENERLQSLVLHQEARLADIEREVGQLTRLRHQLQSDSTALVVAPVVGFDSSAQRETMVIRRGSESGVRVGQWVVAGAGPEERTPGASGAQLMLEQWLVGRVSAVHTHVSRVVLCSDPKFRERVAVVKMAPDGRLLAQPESYVLTGLGRGALVVRQADRDYHELGYERVAVPAAPDLPVMLTIGRIVGSARMAESALHFDLSVEPWGDPRRLRYVYVLAVGG